MTVHPHIVPWPAWTSHSPALINLKLSAQKTEEPGGRFGCEESTNTPAVRLGQ